MTKSLGVLLNYLLAALIIFLTWQIHYIIVPSDNQYSIISLYGFDLLLLLIGIIWLIYWYQSQQRVNWQLVVVGVGCILLVLFSAYWATDRNTAFYYWLRFAAGVCFIGAVATLPLRLRLLGYAFMIAGLLQTVFVWIQFMLQRVQGASWLGMSSQSPITPGTAVVVNAAGRWLRGYGTLPHPNITGGVLVLAVVGALLVWQQTKKSTEQSVLLLITAVLTSGLLLTFSRSAFVVYLLVLGYSAWFVPTTRRLVITSLVTGFVLMIPLWPLLAARFTTVNYTEQLSLTERSQQWSDALTLWQRFWPMGVGIGQYTLHREDAAEPQPLHFVPLLMAIEIGLGATVLWYSGLMILLIKTRWRQLTARTGALWLFSILGLGLFDHYFWTIPSLFFLWCISIGLHIYLSNIRKNIVA